MDQPFGGVQVLLSGDFLQLPPVQAAAMAFESPTWQELKLQHVTLQQNFSDSVGCTSNCQVWKKHDYDFEG